MVIPYCGSPDSVQRRPTAHRTNQSADGSALDRLRVSTINMLALAARSGAAIADAPAYRAGRPGVIGGRGPLQATSRTARFEGILTAEPLG